MTARPELTHVHIKVTLINRFVCIKTLWLGKEIWTPLPQK